ncbi:MAG: cobalamin B12-binding domain-containing protein [Methylobacterium sp.]|uniref:cobalamin B12-binding domain-containing protein n=1 Tax=Methylobacterium sp. TaxID=409 RepID=UPI0025DC70E7|nr:cobalamin B12-binding domain-containing protein [Methylobacterium sp.]MBX9932935.1 cobalamin B12-binding domain-containing protein [Methylobacterium sp.]
MASLDISARFSLPPLHGPVDAHFFAPEILRRSDVFARRAKLLRIVSADVIPRLTSLHRPDAPTVSRDQDVHGLAHLVLGTDLDAAIDFVTGLRAGGVSMETLFVEVLEPTARHLGSLWEEDVCDFIDVTLAVGRLQHLLAVFNETHALPALEERRSVLMTTLPDEKHFFGVAMVEKFLIAGGWAVQSEPGAAMEQVVSLVESKWFAVVGLTLSCDSGLEKLQGLVRSIRERSCNPVVGIMVGGPVFTAQPDLALRLGADASALDAPSAVVLAQKLFDKGAKAGWQTP